MSTINTNKWKIQHEFDHEPTCIIDENDNEVVRLDPIRHWTQRMEIAHGLCGLTGLLEAAELALADLTRAADQQGRITHYMVVFDKLRDAIDKAKGVLK